MKQIIPLIPLLFGLQGCLYFNDTGVSAHLYDNCREYYDACGIYHKECPPNLIDYGEVGSGIKAIGEEIKTTVSGTDLPADDLTGASEKECIEPTTTAQ